MNLYYVTTKDEFECDFVVAQTTWEAKRTFADFYGISARDPIAKFVTEVPASLNYKGPEWLGPLDDLSAFGGTRLPSTHYPRWLFGDRVFGCSLTPVERYGRADECIEVAMALGHAPKKPEGGQ